VQALALVLAFYFRRRSKCCNCMSLGGFVVELQLQLFNPYWGVVVARNERAPFESIEEAKEYLLLLAEAVLESKQDVEADIQNPLNASLERRKQALGLVVYKLDKLGGHLKSSLRILNDLRSLRRLLLEERAQEIACEPTASHGTAGE